MGEDHACESSFANNHLISIRSDASFLGVRQTHPEPIHQNISSMSLRQNPFKTHNTKMLSEPMVLYETAGETSSLEFHMKPSSNHKSN